MKKVFIFVLLFALSISFASCNINYNAVSTNDTETNALYKQVIKNDRYYTEFSRVVNIMNITTLENYYFTQNDIVPFNKLIDYFLRASAFEYKINVSKENINPEYEKYYDEQNKKLVIPSITVDTFLQNTFNTVVNHDKADCYDCQTDSYVIDVVSSYSPASCDIFSISEEKNNIFEVKFVKRSSIQTPGNLIVYKKMAIAVNGENYKILSVQKLEKQTVDYTFQKKIYNDNNIRFEYPTIVSTDKNRENLFNDTNLEIREEIKKMIIVDKKEFALTKVELKYEITYSDFYIISILFTGKAQFNNEPEKKDIFYTLTCSTVKTDEPGLGLLFNIDNNFIETLKSDIQSQNPKEYSDIFTNYTNSDYEDSFQKSYINGYSSTFLLKYYLIDDNLVLFIKPTGENGEYIKTILSLNEIEKFIVYPYEKS